MSELSRRHLLGAAAATAAVTTLTPFSLKRSHAAAPPSGKQVAGIYRYKVGDFECTSVADGVAQFPFPKNWVRNIPDEQAQAAAEAAYMPKGMVRVPFNPQLINTGSKLVLIDTGVGPSPQNPRVGQLMANLAAAGVDPKAIDMVVMSHLHPDHTNGIKTADGGLAFPNAEILVPAQDWAFWMSDENAAKFESNPMMKNYFSNTRRVYGNVPADRVTKYEWGKEVAPGITAIDASGHTPGHTAFAVASGNARVFLQSDITNIPQLFLRNPEWHVAFDIDAPKAVQIRRKFYDMASAEKALVVGFHFPFPSIGHVEKDGANYRLVPIAWEPTI